MSAAETDVPSRHVEMVTVAIESDVGPFMAAIDQIGGLMSQGGAPDWMERLLDALGEDVVVEIGIPRYRMPVDGDGAMVLVLPITIHPSHALTALFAALQAADPVAFHTAVDDDVEALAK